MARSFVICNAAPWSNLAKKSIAKEYRAANGSDAFEISRVHSRPKLLKQARRGAIAGGRVSAAKSTPGGIPSEALLDFADQWRIDDDGAGHAHNLIADGLLGTNAANERFSYDPPEGVAQAVGTRTLDYTGLTADAIRGPIRLRFERGPSRS
jgi:hypothetical protein